MISIPENDERQHNAAEGKEAGRKEADAQTFIEDMRARMRNALPSKANAGKSATFENKDEKNALPEATLFTTDKEEIPKLARVMASAATFVQRLGKSERADPAVGRAMERAREQVRAQMAKCEQILEGLYRQHPELRPAAPQVITEEASVYQSGLGHFTVRNTRDADAMEQYLKYETDVRLFTRRMNASLMAQKKAGLYSGSGIHSATTAYPQAVKELEVLLTANNALLEEQTERIDVNTEMTKWRQEADRDIQVSTTQMDSVKLYEQELKNALGEAQYAEWQNMMKIKGSFPIKLLNFEVEPQLLRVLNGKNKKLVDITETPNIKKALDLMDKLKTGAITSFAAETALKQLGKA